VFILLLHYLLIKYCVLVVITPESLYLTGNDTERSNCVVLQVSQHAAKCIPAMVCPEVTEQIRREIAASLHQRKGDFACYFLTDLVTFTLPAGSYKNSSYWWKIFFVLFCHLVENCLFWMYTSTFWWCSVCIQVLFIKF